MPYLTWILVVLTAVNLVFAVPTPWEPNTAYSGSGGHATGGSVVDESTNYWLERLLAALRINLWSNNGGHGGLGTSGLSTTTASRVTRREKGAGLAGTGSYSGAGGEANGGSFDGIIGLLNVFSNNGGDAGMADSGASLEGLHARQDEYEPTHQ